MDQFFHVRIIISMILGLGLTHLIRGSVGFIQHPDHKKIYSVHLLWVFYVFLLLIHFWWWEYHLKTLPQWFFYDYFFIICYILIFYMICAILYPDDLEGYKGYEDYFYSRKKWFFGLLAICFTADLVDTAIKGMNYFLRVNTEYYLRFIIHVFLFFMAMRTDNKKFHTGLVIVLILYEMSYILRFYNTELQ